MKQGDVFKVAKDDSLYCVATVAPNGTIFAYRFDLYFGNFGAPVEFASSTEVEVLFNSFERAKILEEGWEYCQIRRHVHYIDEEHGYGEEWFEAEAKGPHGSYSAGKSSKYIIVLGEPRISPREQESLHQKLVHQLLNDGWEPILERRLNWWHLTLKRRIRQ